MSGRKLRAGFGGYAPQSRTLAGRGPHCTFCHKRIYKQRNGEWYHLHNGSVSCRPGEGSDRRATP